MVILRPPTLQQAHTASLFGSSEPWVPWEAVLLDELDPHPPKTLLAGRYHVEALLGHGGAATVYRVLDPQSGQRVALKQLRSRADSQVALLTALFEREYHTLSQLAHPSIIEVYDYGVDGGRPYYTMELLDGEDLGERGRLPFREVCSLLCDVASSLAIVHSRGRVHRDLSARNVRCTRLGHAKLIDFGAMVPIGSAPQLCGTPPFVPPVPSPARVVPSSLSAEFTARIEALSADARALAETLALTDPAALSLPDYAALSQHAEPGRTFRALDELVAAAVLVSANDRYAFSQPEFVRLLQARLAGEHARRLHERLAKVLADRAEGALFAHHLLLAGRARDAIEAVCKVEGLETWHRRTFELNAQTLGDGLEQAPDLDPRLRIDAQQRLLRIEAFRGRLDRFLRHAPAVLDQLQRDSGLNDATITTAAAASEHVFSREEAAVRMLALSQAFMVMGLIAQDLELLERIPSLEPLADLGPAAATLQHELEVQRAMQAGRYSVAFEQSAAQVERLQPPACGGLDPVEAERARLGQLHLQGLVLAGGGFSVPPALLAALDAVPSHRALAWHVRMASELIQCNFEAGYACERRAALIHLQDGGMLPETTLRLELLVQLNSDNLTGVQKSLKRIEEMAVRYPGWRSTCAIARCHGLRLQGDLEAAWLALQPALELTSAGRHMDWELVVQSQLQILIGLGRSHQAVQIGRQAVEQAQASQVALGFQARAAFATALLHAGDIDGAQQSIEQLIANLTQRDAHGLHLGTAYETRARVAIARRDSAALHHATERCAREFKVGENSVMNARYERLLREVAAAGLPLPPSAHWVAAPATPATDSVARTVYSRMLTCIGSLERAKEVLNLLLEASGARTGYLFGLRTGQIVLLSSVDQSEAPQDLVETLERYLRDELDEQAGPDQVVSASQSVQALQPWIDAWGREFEPLVLTGTHDGDAVIAGIAALHHEGDPPPALRNGLLQALSEALIAADIIDPITCVG